MIVRAPPPASARLAPRAEAAAPSLFDVVGERLETLIPLFGLRRQTAAIRRCYRRICAESLALPIGERPQRRSRLNADGTPFQLALALGAGTPPLQFLAEPGPPLAGNAERLVAAREAVEELAHQFGAAELLPRARALLDELAPPDDLDLLADEAGPVWLGASFAPSRGPRLKIYVNLKWGREKTRWGRLERFAASTRFAARWESIRPLVEGKLEPLGVSVDLGAEGQIGGRIYLSGYGRSLHDYEAAANACDPALGGRLRRYATTLLGDDRFHPTRSAVFSLGTQAGSQPDCKIEFCAHCALAGDLDARARSLEWLGQAGVSSAPYRQVLHVLSGGSLSSSATELHVYLGIGMRRGRLCSTFYLNPAAGIR